MLSARLLIASPLLAAALWWPASARASAGEILLGPALQPITFTGNNTTISVRLGTCISSTCSLDGAGVGTDSLASAGLWNTTSSRSALSLSRTSTGSYLFNSTGPVAFRYGAGGSLLSGTMQLLAATQSPGTLNASLSGGLQVTGGSLSSALGPAANVSFSLLFVSPTDLDSLRGASAVGRTIRGALAFGNIAPTPEPESLLLIGTGLVLAGTILRKRINQSNSVS